MSKESLQELKAIKAGAPKGATHVDLRNTYYQHKKSGCFAVWMEYRKDNSTFLLSQCVLIIGIRSLSDIERIIELEQFKNNVTELIKWSKGQDQ